VYRIKQSTVFSGL